jgi:hypothetical protein
MRDRLGDLHAFRGQPLEWQELISQPSSTPTISPEAQEEVQTRPRTTARTVNSN